jgi:small subunit ribosomal protein S1
MGNENFAQLFAESLRKETIDNGAILAAAVEKIDSKYVVVSAGFKSECYIPIEQFYDDQGKMEVKVGDQVMVALEALEDGFGNTRLSRERARRNESWARLEQAYADKTIVTGIVSGRVKGGFNVEIDKIRAFLPGSLVDTKPVKDPEAFEGKEFEFKVIKIDAKRNNIVVSRRAVIEAETGIEKATLLEGISDGQEIKGIVKNITDYGAFVDLGGIDGLLHITDISWKRIKHPSEVLAVGDEVKVKVLKIDRTANRVSLGVKQLGRDPWIDINTRYPVNKRIKGQVTNMMDYGCFVEFEEGIEGLVHVSEMDWTNKNVNPGKVVHLGQEVEVMVLEVDNERRRISLGLKQCTPNPWEEYAKKYNKGERIAGKIRSITDFGIFVGLEGGIDGLIYASDISWNEQETQECLRKYQKGDEIAAIILTIDAERERISLGLKQLTNDPLAVYLDEHAKGTLVSGVITDKDDKRLLCNLSHGVTGILAIAELAEGVSADIGSEFAARVIGIDRKANAVTLSLKVPAEAKQKAVAKNKKLPSESNPKSKHDNVNLKATLGDILKQQMQSK